MGSSLLPRGSTPYGSVGPSWHLCQPSNRCGSQSKNTTSPAQPSSTESASKSQPEEAPGPIEVQLLLSNTLKLSLIIVVWFFWENTLNCEYMNIASVIHGKTT